MNGIEANEAKIKEIRMQVELLNVKLEAVDPETNLGQIRRTELEQEKTLLMEERRLLMDEKNKLRDEKNKLLDQKTLLLGKNTRYGKTCLT